MPEAAGSETDIPQLAGIDRLLSPRSIAAVGASNNPYSIGGWVFANLARAFGGPVYPVHPRDEQVQGRRAFPDIEALPEAVDLAVIVVPAPSVPGAIAACADRGIGGAAIITSGFSEAGPDGASLQEQVSETCRRSGLRVLGPNCIGFMNVAGGVMANFALHPTSPLPAAGPVGLVSQSGGFGSYITSKALLAGLRLGWFVSTGNEVDVNAASVLRYLVEREETKVVMMFSETLRDPDLFVDTAWRAAQLDKPMIFLHAGRSEAAAKAALSHTASLVGPSEVLDAVAHQYGMFVVETMEQMLDLGTIFQDGRRVRDRRVAIMTTSGGAGVLLADACTKAGLSIPELPAAEQDQLRQIMPEPFYGSTTNPVDTTAQVVNVPDAFEKVLRTLGDSPSVDMVIPVTWAIESPMNDALVAYYRSTEKAIAVTSTGWLDSFQEAGLPTYTDPQRAANALGALATLSLRQDLPPRPSDWHADPIRTERVGPLLELPVGRRSLLESSAKQVLIEYGVPVTREQLVSGPEEAVDAAARIGGAVAEGCRQMLAEVARRAPEAAIEGILVQQMVPARLELTCGLHRDPVFGPIVAVALGGILVEILKEAAFLRPPFGADNAGVALASLLGGRLVGGSRGLTPEEQRQVADVMVGLGRLSLEFEQVVEVDVNPLRVADDEVCAADALIVLTQ